MYLYLEHGQSVQYFARQFSFAGCQVLNRIASYKFWVSHSHPLHRSWGSLACKSEPMVCSSTPDFILVSSSFCALVKTNPKFDRMKFNICGLPPSDAAKKLNVECVCSTTSVLLSIDVKTVYKLNGLLVILLLTVQNYDWWKTHINFVGLFDLLQCVQSESCHTHRGDRGGPRHFCTSEHF